MVTFPPPGPDALKDARTRALTHAPPLTASPPIRLEVVREREDGAAVLFLTINHTALDGPACLRVLATAAEICTGATTTPPAAPSPHRAPPGAPGPALRGPSPWTPPARVAPGTPEPHPPSRPATASWSPTCPCRAGPRAPRTPSTTSSWPPPP